MTAPVIPLEFARSSFELLPEGRSPAAWRRDMARAGAGAAWIIRSCAGLRFPREKALSLQQRPLFGPAIDLLTKAVMRPEGGPPAAVQRYSATAARPLGFTTAIRRTARKAAGEGEPSLQQAASCLQQPTKAPREMLAWLAGGAGGSFTSRDGAREAPAKETTPASVARPVRTRAAATPAQEVQIVPFPEMKSADQARGELEQRLVARVAAQLREYGHRLPVETSSAAVADQWSAHLAGPMAPAELLEIEYLNQFVSSGGSTEEIMPKTTEDRWLARRSGSRALSDAQITASRRGGRRVSRQVALDSQHADEEATSATLSVRSHDPAFEIDEDAIAARPASMVVRQATEEEGISQDDLTVLSTKLKRILEEEARRHGIDV